jgi:hypothetical protein
MSQTHFSPQSNDGGDCFKEAVCIHAGRVYDSCSDKDCIDHLPVYFSDCMQSIINEAVSVKCRNVQVMDVYMDVEAVPFNKGFYSVDMTFYFAVQLDAYQTSCVTPTIVDGVACFSKKVILYGSEGNVSVFTSDKPCTSLPSNRYGKDIVPRATIQVVQPICLCCHLMECCPVKEMNVNIPMEIASKFKGQFCPVQTTKMVEVTLGIFSIVSLERMVQMMVPVYDFCIPDKECVQTCDDPCELFRKIKFPVDEFFPPKLQEDEDEDCFDEDCGCEDD